MSNRRYIKITCRYFLLLNFYEYTCNVKIKFKNSIHFKEIKNKTKYLNILQMKYFLFHKLRTLRQSNIIKKFDTYILFIYKITFMIVIILSIIIIMALLSIINSNIEKIIIYFYSLIFFLNFIPIQATFTYLLLFT
jgi:hypothetical protein